MKHSNRRQLFNHLIGAQQNRQWHGETERLGGLAVQDHLNLCRAARTGIFFFGYFMFEVR